ncbi:phage holin family protein [Demequina lignilytica]|uniref:Phage holin family protein n=1 Tax=Demequina lignilytica TaxID=3051663 RepID=A0AAW7MA62_9MICO|nr:MULTISPECIES: phage holin family protein [unclassified Demequina]MDN4478698.1 phage holin family protein [Demequina sp. SYSU T00039-1]MDN4483250.1 phage holin family protein [Demequina sp. SYSU T0a273]MDN4488676.1 phage holin family protein [Demequina sp. SYSU T00039]MDN4491868.1 phage holin family protein [Demequina sp. SYSU T00068]
MPDNFGRYFVNAIVAGLVGRIIGVVKTEYERAKVETAAKLKGIGIGVGLLVAAAAIGFFLLGVLITAAILGLATVWPAWLAALTVGGAMLLIILILAGIGASMIKKNKDLTPQQSIDNIKAALPLVD